MISLPRTGNGSFQDADTPEGRTMTNGRPRPCSATIDSARVLQLLQESCRLCPAIDDLNQNPPLRTVWREQRRREHLRHLNTASRLSVYRSQEPSLVTTDAAESLGR
ncbi:hypothetical protein HPB47_006432 [Ixodes persulcatus]|uniref:Uncharacterized protein n=1 Tax=Ixodes persulcatus TaxID=34615 RepID=A0AC60PAB1_IXOPE|nr:hypothetical protein HPB47_006432 [Ixodes persulcatus]